jgi:hypothetical protein
LKLLLILKLENATDFIAMSFLVPGLVDLDFLLHLGFGQSRKHGLQVQFRLGKRSAQPEDTIVTQIMIDVFRLDTCRQSEAPFERIGERIVGAGDVLSFAFNDDHILLKGDLEFLGLVLGYIECPLKQKWILSLNFHNFPFIVRVTE